MDMSLVIALDELARRLADLGRQLTEHRASLLLSGANQAALSASIAHTVDTLRSVRSQISDSNWVRQHWKTRKKWHGIDVELETLISTLVRLSDSLSADQRYEGELRSTRTDLMEALGDLAAHGLMSLSVRLGETASYYHAREAVGVGQSYRDRGSESPIRTLEPSRVSASADPFAFDEPLDVPRSEHHFSMARATPTPRIDNTSLSTLIPVFFATDRRLSLSSDAHLCTFLDGRGEGVLTFGVAEVSIPPGHEIGKVERPSIWKFQFLENLERHVVITECEATDFGIWKSRASDRLHRTETKSALVFIHGFNVAFDDAIRRAAQIGYDLQFDGLISAYSWGSEGETVRYMADEDNVKLTIPLLIEFLAKLRNEVGVSTIHVIAHSMGNRALVGALEKMPCPSQGTTYVEQAVLAAPDIDAELFKQAVADLKGKAKRFTLYGSSADDALRLSKSLRSGYPRAGDGGQDIVVVDGVDTIDATNVGTDLFGIGHSYFASKRTVLSDLHYVIRIPLPPSDRAGLVEATKDKTKYWIFHP